MEKGLHFSCYQPRFLEPLLVQQADGESLSGMSRILFDLIAITCCQLQLTLVLENLPKNVQNMSLNQDFQLTK
jgi:hypothetical protein